ncbi:GGDEF domain-containing protein [Kineosporia babensis]|uniref:GGDEF domain-containing protein n=1 Tax=Kineosporia babensis TaxID=499548 RepID=A0A9X1NG31_9ACTN|nr:GGDEF domain-containing protein [Kineosporia babensis]MCD5313275.1 GGDEF domain-containing protein [Kineosporia babensis]
MNAGMAGARRAMLVCRIGAELLDAPGTDASHIRATGWNAIRDLVNETPGLLAVRLALTADGFGLGPWLGPFTDRPSAIVFPDGTNQLDANVPLVHDILDQAVGTSCIWHMITYPQVAPEVTMALGHPEQLDMEVLLTARSILNQVMLAYRTSLVHDEASQNAATDDLTRLASQQAFTEVLDEHLEQPGAGEATLLLIDLDDFTALNEACGHETGDDVLRRVADILREIVRGSDVVARLGSDDFAVLLLGIDQAAAERIADRIVFAVSTLTVGDTAEISTGASIGVVSLGADADLHSLMLRAEVALKVAKRRGRGQVQTWRADMTPVTPPEP